MTTYSPNVASSKAPRKVVGKAQAPPPAVRSALMSALIFQRRRAARASVQKLGALQALAVVAVRGLLVEEGGATAPRVLQRRRLGLPAGSAQERGSAASEGGARISHS